MPNITLFTAAWCQPCKRARPIVEEFAARRGLAFRVVDIEQDPAAATRYAIRGVPTIVYEHGEIVRRHAGSVPTLGQLKELVEDD